MIKIINKIIRMLRQSYESDNKYIEYKINRAVRKTNKNEYL